MKQRIKAKTAAVFLFLAPVTVMEMDSSEGLLLLLLYSHHLTSIIYLLRHSTEQPSSRPLPLQTAHTANHLLLTQYITMFYPLSTLLRVLVASAASIPFVAAQNQTKVTTDDLYGNLVSTVAPTPGFNAEGGSVFTNFVNAVNDKQFFFLNTFSVVFEKPGSEPAPGSTINWCSDLTSSDLSNSSIIGYAARCVGMWLAGYAEHKAAGDQLTDVHPERDFGSTEGVSAVFVEQLNIFECQLHSNTDGYTIRYWDDGRKTMPRLGWEGHDEGDMSANAATSSWSAFVQGTWMSIGEVAQLLNTSTDEFTPEKFKQVYLDTWIKEHEKEAAEKNPNAEAELEIIEAVKNETDGRKLVSVVAERFVSATLGVFGI